MTSNQANVNCESMMELLSLQSPLYQPGVFWQEASKDMVEDLAKNGIENFRRLSSSLSYFVPTYGFPGNALSETAVRSLKDWLAAEQLSQKQSDYLNQLVTGYSAALADYRTLAASEYAVEQQPNLLSFSESHIGDPIEHFSIEGKFYSRSALNYLLGLSFLKKHFDLTTCKRVMEIGGGFGTLGEILHKVLPEAQYIDIDIPPTLCCSTHYLTQIVGEDKVSSYQEINAEGFTELDQLKPVTVLPSWMIEKLTGKIDLFVNFISFQEMEPDIVQNYLYHVTRLQADWVLLRNMREGKQLRSQHRVGVDKPIFSEDYARMLPDYELIEKNVIPFGFKTVDGFHSELMLFKRMK
ncbi:MAG: putative sugar O-methyltransferase [Thiotrichales bacterium]|jgi:putative sugar O-methyltransferase|nr:putative sugar O-methyltransferase [Thiotrichales bacterium]